MFADEHAYFLNDIGKRTVDFDKLTVFGPIMAQRWDVKCLACPSPVTAPWPINAEFGVQEDGDRSMEFSMKCPASHAAFGHCWIHRFAR